MLRRPRFRALRRLLAVLAAVGVLATPLRLWADCPMLGPVADQVAEGTHGHATHSARASSAGADVQPSHGSHLPHSEPADGDLAGGGPGPVPVHDVCLDLAHCVVAATLSAAERLDLEVSSPEEQGSAPVLAFSDAARALDPPPPKRR